MFFLVIQNLNAQKINGQVTDAKTGQVLPFVNIKFNQGQQGTTTDINGRFEIVGEINQLHFFYVGYLDTIVKVKKGVKFIDISMNQVVTELAEVEILPGINPAHRIIQMAIKNRKSNRPESLNSFSYVSYNKMIFTAEPDTAAFIPNDSIPLDSMKYRLKEFINRQHFFLLESASKRSYLEGRTHEIVNASRVSGLKDPFFMLLATQFQSFSFYEPQFNILGENYINPLMPGSISNYFFLLHDTLYQGVDTVFIITFRPLKNKSFDGLKGFVYINTDGYAVQNVIAEPNEPNVEFGIKIQQLYEKIDGKAWFPTQLNTTLSLGSILVNDMPVVGLGTTYLDSIKIDPPLKRSMFRGKVSLEVAKTAGKQSENNLDNYRVDSLTQRDLNTYHFMDSIGKSINIDRKIKSIRILTTGRIPMGKFSIPIDKFIGYNQYEKFRLGTGIETNDRLSRYFFLSAYGAYGTGDKAFKYGGNIFITPKPNSDFKITLGYKNDVEESGAAYQFTKISNFSSEVYRRVLVNKMNKTEDFDAQIQVRVLKYFLWNFGANYSRKAVIDNYKFRFASAENISVLGSDFNIFTANFGFKFAWGEKLFRNPEKLISMGTKYPILQFRYSRGLNTSISDLVYNRIDFQIDKVFHMRYLGKSKIQIKGGYIDESLPWYMLYNSLGSYLNFYIHTDNSFNTMRVNEFLSDRYAALFWQHDFGKVIFKKNKYFTPDWILVNNFGWGDISNSENHKNINIKSMEKGYMETGLLLNKITRSTFSSIGFGVYYRYGPYSLPSIADNFSYRMTVGFSF